MKQKSFLTIGLIIIVNYCIPLEVHTQSIKTLLADSIDIVVSKKGTGDFLTIQEAINSTADNSSERTVIFIEKGIYFEKVVVPISKKNLFLVGEDMDSTILVYDDCYDKSDTLWPSKTYTLRVDAPDFWAMNMTIKNSVKSFQKALAVFSNGDRQIFTHCRLIGWTGNYFINLRCRNYFKDCFIEGVYDYIYGFGVAVFDSCQIHAARTDTYTTLSGTPKDYKFGFVFRNCNFTPSAPLSGIALGRPWFYNARIVLIKCQECEGIMPVGWTNFTAMKSTCYLGEYQCFGPGSDTTQRKGGKQLTDQEAEKYILDSIFSKTTFPIDMPHATSEVDTIYNKLLVNGAKYHPEYFLNVGRDTLPAYPTSDWKVRVDENTIYQVIKNNTYMLMDSISGTYSVQNILVDQVPLPGFDTTVTLYGLELDDTATIPPIATTVTTNAVVDIKYPEGLPGFTSIMISSKNKLNHKQYKIYNSKDSAFWNTGLKYILINSKTDTLHIVPGVYEYNQLLPTGKTSITYFNPKLENPDSRAIITMPESIPGTVKIKVIAVDTNTTEEYLINYSLTSSIEDHSSLQEPTVFQNPFRNNIIFDISLDKTSPIDFMLYDVHGRLVLSEKNKIVENDNKQLKIYSENLQNGIYFYRLIIKDDEWTGKILKVD